MVVRRHRKCECKEQSQLSIRVSFDIFHEKPSEISVFIPILNHELFQYSHMSGICLAIFQQVVRVYDKFTSSLSIYV